MVRAEPQLFDDASDEGDARAEGAYKPWWSESPGLDAARNEALVWLESAQDKPVEDDDSDAIHHELLSGAVWRELARARDDFARARVRYADAVRRARVVGFSWGEMGRVLGVRRQLLHRRFRHDVD